MLMVTPTGSTKEAHSFDTFNFFSTVSMFTGSVAALLLVVKANSCTGYIARIKSLALMRVNRLVMAG